MLLVDTILNADNPLMRRTLGLRHDAICAQLRKAQKFVLDRGFAIAADSVRDSEVEKFIKHALPPFDTVWLEVNAADRHIFAKSPTDPGTVTPQKVGILISADLNNFKKYTADLFWRFNKREYEIAFVSMSANLTDLWTAPTHVTLFSKETGLLLSRDHYLYRFLPSQTGFIGANLPHDTLKQSPRNWGGEVEFWSSVLALISCRNAAVIERVERSAALAKTSRKTLSDYHICKLRLSAAVYAASDDDSEQSAIRAHFVRGHFKRRKTGLFWWSPYVRGDKSLGFVQKDYLVKA